VCTSPVAADIRQQDDLGREVILEKPATRIISLAPHLTETIFAAGAGDRLVGTVSYSDFPEAAKAGPRVGSYDTVSFETVLAMEPDLVFACRHQPIRALVVGLVLSAGLVWIAWLVTPARYRAEGLVRVRQQQDVIFSAQTSRSADTTFFYSQEQLVVSPQVLSAALEHEDIRALSDLIPRDEQVEWLRDQLQVEIESGSEVMSIAAVNQSPRLAYALANAVTQSYLGEVTNRMALDRERRKRELERAAKEADKRLDELWTELNTAAQTVGSDSSQSLTIRDELQLQAYRDYSRQLQAAQIRGNELEAQLASAMRRNSVNGPEDGPVTDMMIQNDPEVMAVKQRVQGAKSQIEQMRQIVADPNSPRLQRLMKDLEFYEADLQQVIETRSMALQEQLRNQTQSARENSLVELQQQIDRNRAEKEFLRQRMSEIDTGITRTEDKTGVQLDMWRHAIQRQTGLADSLWQSLQELKIESQSQPRVTLIELANVPSSADHSRRLKAAGAAGLMAWIMAVLGVGYVEWRDCRIRFSEDLTSRFALPVFGKDCPNGSGAVNRKRISSGPREAAAQMMLLDSSGDHIPSLMVGSAANGEPRHLVATELARSLCKFRRRTLLIDADTNGNRLSRALGVDKLPGLRQLTPSSDVRHLIVPSEQEGLDFLSIGLRQEDENWVDPEVLRHVIDSLRDEYRAIVVCGPALLSSAESLLLASQVDVLLMAVQMGTSRWNQLAMSAQSAIQAGIGIGGCILQYSKRGRKLRLQPDRQGETVAPSHDTSAEASLHAEIGAMKRELDQARREPSESDSSRDEQPTSQTPESPNPETTT